MRKSRLLAVAASSLAALVVGGCTQAPHHGGAPEEPQRGATSYSAIPVPTTPQSSATGKLVRKGIQVIDGLPPSATIAGRSLRVVAIDWDDINGAATVNPPEAIVWPVPNAVADTLVTLHTRSLPKRVVANSFGRIDSNGIPDEQTQREQLCTMLIAGSAPARPGECAYSQTPNGEVEIQLSQRQIGRYTTIQAAWFPRSPTEGEVSVTWIARY